MMSWAGGWFFLMAAESYSVGERDFRLPGLGSFLQQAASESDVQSLTWGIVTLIVVVVALDQLVWRPLLAWADRFKLEMVEDQEAPTSWFYDLLQRSALIGRVRRQTAGFSEWADRWMLRFLKPIGVAEKPRGGWSPMSIILVGVIVAGVGYGAFLAAQTLLLVNLAEWWSIAVGLLATLLRVTVAMLIALAWTIPVGVAIGSSPRLARWLQPVVQVTASIPATALFPAFLLLVIALPNGLNMAAVLLMLMGTQWYLLFNVIAGASAIPQDLKHMSSLLHLGRWERWRVLILPALFPYIITGAITASGGAWNV